MLGLHGGGTIDANGNGLLDNGEAKTMAQLGITALHYSMGSYDRNGQTFQMASPDLSADTQGTAAQAIEGGIIVGSSNGQTALVVTKTQDLSNIAPGKDSITNGIEDITVDVLATDLLKNDRVGGAAGSSLTIAAVGGAVRGSVSYSNGTVQFIPEANYNGSDAGFTCTARYANGNTADAQVSLSFAAVNDMPKVTDPGVSKTADSSCTSANDIFWRFAA